MTPFSQVKAQYPDVPKDVKEAADKMMAEEQASSDAACTIFTYSFNDF